MSLDHGPGSTREDISLSCSDLACCQQQRSSRTRFGLHSASQEIDSSSVLVFTSDKSPFLKVLSDAEVAANAAAIQIVSFKDAMDDEFADSRPPATDKRRFARQRGLLLEKLEDFRRLNKSVRQKLRQLQDSEADRLETNRRIDVLKNKMAEAKRINECLRNDVTAAETKVEELAELRREEQEKIKSAVNLTKSVEATRAHLQGQLRNKEAENNRLTVQLRSLEKTLIEQKTEINGLNHHISTLTKKAENAQESLKKACQAQKLRAEKFEAAIEECYDELKEKDLQLTSARLELDSRRRKKEKMRDETDKVVAHVDLLKSEVSDLTARLQREKNNHVAATETLMQQVKNLTTENGELGASNALLQASVSKLEQQLTDCESALVEETVVSQERKRQVELAQYQVTELQAEVEHLLRGSRVAEDQKGVEVQKLRRELQDCLQGLKSCTESLRVSEKSLSECQDNLQRSHWKCSEKTESIRQLQAKMEGHTKFLRSSLEMRESMHKASLQLQEKMDSLNKQMENLRQENLELVRKLGTQEEAFRCSNRQLEQRTSECQALRRQLEEALLDVKQQVNKVKEQSVSKEEALQTKIVELEAEKSRRDNEMRLLHQSKHMAEKQFEVRLKDLQLSLDQSESHKQSVQNYVDFLKQFYTTVFDEGPQMARFGSSYFPR
ncbi:outer dense fiber protein 2 isoform X1 [Takifugu rubripes]|uniref:Outer dense fiber protein 2 n=1 Tax=Takifugu rubripes TaxID=31033 RepID=A0A3B5KIR8_TAKRU|nr:outer dense fiber protein 2 isoform X1 [Takifugu rubripes]XP_029687113.1 outer dense fiber protein 2 isoform X1 [Takifugu rubripes]